MNAIFALIFLASAGMCLAIDPEGFLPALMAGAQKAITVCLALVTGFCVWLAFFKVLEESGLANKLTKFLYPVSRRLFRSENKDALYLATSNLSANLLGLPGAPTPLGVKATQLFMREGNGYAADMLFVLNATSLQLLPTTVIALRAAYESASPADVLLPTLIATFLSTLTGVLLVVATAGRKRKRR